MWRPPILLRLPPLCPHQLDKLLQLSQQLATRKQLGTQPGIHFPAAYCQTKVASNNASSLSQI